MIADGAPSQAASLSLAFLGDVDSVHLRRWAGYFASHGHRVHVLVPADQAIEPGLSEAIHVERYEPYWASRVRPIGAWRTRRSLRHVLARLVPDVLHAHYLTMHGWMARLSGFHPYAVTVWGSDVFVTARAGRRAALYARLTLAAADLVTGDSADLVAAAIAAGARRERTYEVQFGVDLEQFRSGPQPVALQASLGLSGHRLVFSPRTIAPLYRQEVVLRALKSLPADVAVLMTRHESRPDDVAAIERLADELGLRDRVRIVPDLPHESMIDAYRLADVVVSVPRSDATPVTILEALAVGRPVVASDVPSVREWLADLDPESLVPIDDVPATAEAIRRALDRPSAAAATVAQHGRDLVARRASQQAAMRQAEVLYRSLSRGPGR